MFSNRMHCGGDNQKKELPHFPRFSHNEVIEVIMLISKRKRIENVGTVWEEGRLYAFIYCGHRFDLTYLGMFHAKYKITLCYFIISNNAYCFQSRSVRALFLMMNQFQLKTIIMIRDAAQFYLFFFLPILSKKQHITQNIFDKNTLSVKTTDYPECF